ncbi:venom carboxylesterase-6-like [Uranotaenia lowii]|uniref:venom carboxylesterase-6-like n=1 Tax=Uranotaenia lowii TaxID=190385 RepID=UPI002478CCD9|nr:venom carboxylesterase-6-like [Uranotaenia lowii]
MRLRVFLAIAVTFAVKGVESSLDQVIVRTTNGPIRGVKRENYYAFEGIPYAKSPTGEFRLAAPVLNDAIWEEPLDVSKPGPNCIQWNHYVQGEDKLVGEEDCLYLNVYTTSLSNNREPLPTIFHIHGGALMFGSGDFWRPDHLLEKPFILVTFNYRLGPLGFLSTEDDVIPGNFGLKDQATALEWTRKNIHLFGGHPDQITVTGYSAGSSCVQLFYLSPMTRGKFKNAIGHSGSALNPWVLAEDSSEKAQKIATAVGCSTRSTREMLMCLREQPAERLVRAVTALFDFLYNPFSPLGVVIEHESKENPRPFLTDHPYTLMEQGKFDRVPLLLSVNGAEGLYPGAEFLSKPEYLQRIEKEWNRLLPSILDYKSGFKRNEARMNEISEIIRKRYLGDEPLSEDNFLELIRLMSNRLFFAGVVESIRLMQRYIPVYFYLDQYKTAFGVGEYLSETGKNLGCAHGEDVWLIHNNDFRRDVPYSDEERLMARRFVEMYGAFTRDSVAKFDRFEIPKTSDGGDKLQFLEINFPDSTLRSAEQLNDEDFWNQMDFNEGVPEKLALTRDEL